MEANKFELTGKINWHEIKMTGKGQYVTRAFLVKKVKDDVYQSFPLTMFGDIAETFANTVEAKKDTVHVAGRLSISSYEKDGKTIEKVDLIATEFEKVVYSEKDKKYVVIAQQTDEVPWGN